MDNKNTVDSWDFAKWLSVSGTVLSAATAVESGNRKARNRLSALAGLLTVLGIVVKATEPPRCPSCGVRVSKAQQLCPAGHRMVS